MKTLAEIRAIMDVKTLVETAADYLLLDHVTHGESVAIENTLKAKALEFGLSGAWLLDAATKKLCEKSS